MTGKARLTGIAALCALGALGPLAGPSSAQKGVLGTGADARIGIVDPDGSRRYTALPAGAGPFGEGTVVTKLDTADGRVDAHSWLDQPLVVPSVAYDGSPGGLSFDGDTLVLAEPAIRFPQTESTFTVLDTRNLRVLDELSFDGTYTFDAISPDGRSLYLIEYTSPRDLTEYRVREYDLRQGRFNPEPIIDPNESGEDMYGSPVTREQSPDGRWAYTLYDGREHPFIHALDTVGGTAVCIDLDGLHRLVYGRTGLEPSPDGSTLTVVQGSRPVELVDTRTFEVSEPPPPPVPTPAAADDGSVPWAAIALAGGLVGLLVALTWVLGPAARGKAGDEAHECEPVP